MATPTISFQTSCSSSLAMKLPHDLHFSSLAPSTRKSHLRTQPATWKLGFSCFSSCRSGGRVGEAVAVSGGNVREFSSRVSRCKASCSARRWHSGGFAPHALLEPAALPVWMAVVTDEILCVDSMFVSPPQLKKMWLDFSPCMQIRPRSQQVGV